MKRVGIVAEYNPFHLGHRKQLHNLRKNGADQIVVAMSGSFVQRGLPAIVNKWQRAAWAVYDADLIVELPAVYVLRSAEYFARGAVRLLAALGCTHLAFGAETPDLEKLRAAAAEPDTAILQRELAAGTSYPVARIRALPEREIAAEILSEPNNLLAVAYLRAIREYDLPLIPIPLPRKRGGNPAHADGVSGEHIRAQLAECQVPQGVSAYVANDLQNNLREGNITVFAAYEQSILPLLRRMKTNELNDIGEFSEGLENKFYALRHAATLEEFWQGIKSKRYPHARIRRLTAQYALGMRRADLAYADNAPPGWVRPLAMRMNAGPILKSTPLPVITRIARARHYLVPAYARLLAYDLRATDLAALAHRAPETRAGGLDYYHAPIVKKIEKFPFWKYKQKK